MPGTTKVMLGLVVVQIALFGAPIASPTDEAKDAARSLLADVSASHGPDSVRTAEALDLLVDSLYFGGEYRTSETIALAAEAVALRIRLHGPRHPAVAASLHRQSLIVYFDARRVEASALASRALEIRRETLDAMDPALAESLEWVGTLYYEDGEAERGLIYLRESVVIREALGPYHPDLAESLNYLANCLSQLGRYEEALEQHRRSDQILERANGKDDPEVARSLYNQGLIHLTLGEFDVARELLERSLPIMEASGGPAHPRVMIARGGLASLLRITGDYAAARALYENALAGLKLSFGDDQPYYAALLSSLAGLHEASGNLDDALDCHERARQIRVEALGPEHPAVASSLSSLASIHGRLGAPDKAAALFSSALQIAETVSEEDVLLLAGILLDMSRSRQATDDPDASEKRLRRSMEIFETAFGRDHMSLVDPLTEIGRLQAADGRLVEARASFERALDLLEQSFGEQYPERARVLNADAMTLIRLRKFEKAFDETLLGARIARNHVRATAQVLPEREALGYTDFMRDNLDSALTIAVSARDSLTRPVARVWDAVIRGRALILDEMAARRRSVTADADPEVRRLFGEYRSATERVAFLLARGPGDLSPERHRSILDDARRQSEAAEIKLAEYNSEFRSTRVDARTGFDEVRKLLPTGSGLLAYVLFDRRDLSPRGEGQRDAWTVTPTYAAFVLGPDGGAPRLFELGPASEIDAAVRAWRSAAGGVPPSKGKAARKAEATYRAVGTTLRKRIWAPVVASLAKAEFVFVVPDGSLNLVNLTALPVGQDRFLVETGPTLHLLSTERDLLVANRPRGSGLLAVGAPDFGAATRGMSRGNRDHCPDLGSIRFAPLPAADREIREVSEMWLKSRDDAIRLTGGQATEHEFKRLAPGKRTIHLATHGFFLDGRCATTAAGSRGIGGLVSGADLPAQAPRSGNPLVLSGLVLAGANQRASIAPGDEDGLLMAEEIATLDLSGTEWAVLSACNTAIGEVRPGEGVFGLRRAFRVAGAGTVVMSLWPVQDAAAREWMRALYEARLEQGLDTAGAVRSATLGTLEARRKTGRSVHPFFWAGFVASGDWK